MCKTFSILKNVRVKTHKETFLGNSNEFDFFSEKRQNLRGNNYNNMGLFVCKMYIISSCDRADGCKYSKCRVTLHTIRAFFCL